MVAQQSPASSLKDRLIGKLALLSKLKGEVCVLIFGTISVECLAVTIKCPDHPEQKQLAKKLPGTMTIQKLKGLLQRMYKVNSSDQKLSYVDKRVSMHTHIPGSNLPIDYPDTGQLSGWILFLAVHMYTLSLWRKEAPHDPSAWASVIWAV